MTKYVTRADNDWWDQGPLLPALSVPENTKVDTGLLNHRGERIFRLPNAIGFGRQ